MTPAPRLGTLARSLPCLRGPGAPPVAKPFPLMLADFLPLLLMIAMAAGLAMTLLKAAELIGPSRPNRIKISAYESGMDPVGTARERYSVKFYLIAMIFIVFDVEVVFMYPWAASFRNFLDAGAALGLMAVMLLFIVVLGIGLLYDVKKGGLNFD